MITRSQLKAIMPHSTEAGRDLYIDHLNAAMQKYRINTPMRIAAFLAQVAHESGSLRYVEEIASGKAYEFREDLGNLKPAAIRAARAQGKTTGPFYKGHGLIQITGFDNHKECGEALGLDLVNNPRLLCEPQHAAMSAAWFWNRHGCNDLADVGMFGAITKRINGGYNGAKERLAMYVNAKKVLSA